MNQASSIAPTRRRNRKRLVVLLAVVAVGVAILGVWLLRPARGVVFSVNAHTSVLTVILPCDQDLVWDLPAGELTGRSAADLLPVETEKPVTITLYGGAGARLVALPTGRISVTLDAGEEKACDSALQPRVTASIDGKDMEPDSDGYQYFSASPTSRPGGSSGNNNEPASDAQAAADTAQTTFALPLVGRVILGENLPYGAGWSGATPLLHSGEYRARRIGASRGEQNTYIEGSLDAGSVVDTQPVTSSAYRGRQASGFVQVRPEGLEAQVYKPREISVLSYAGSPMVFSVPRWRVVVRSAAAQVGLALATVVIGALGLALSWLEALPDHRLSSWLRGIAGAKK